MNKYLNIPTEVDGIKFLSRKEATRYQELVMMQRAGLIENLELQPRYDLIVNGEDCGYYQADFRYKVDGRTVVEDCKADSKKGKRSATKTPVYMLKKKLMFALYRIKIVET